MNKREKKSNKAQKKVKLFTLMSQKLLYYIISPSRWSSMVIYPYYRN